MTTIDDEKTTQLPPSGQAPWTPPARPVRPTQPAPAAGHHLPPRHAQVPPATPGMQGPGMQAPGMQAPGIQPGPWMAPPAGAPFPGAPFPGAPFPGAPFPGASFPGSPAAPRRSRAVLLRIGAVSAVAACAVAAVFVATRHGDDSSTAAEQPAGQSVSADAGATGKAPVAPTALQSLLIPPNDIPGIAGVPPAGPVQADRVYTAFWDGEVADDECRSPIATGADTLYQGSGWTSTRYQASSVKTGDSNGSYVWRSTEVVTSYPTAELATAFLGKVKETWGRCANRSINGTVLNATDPAQYFWTMGAVTATDTAVSMPMSQEGADGWACQTGVMVRNNVAIEVSFCSVGSPAAALENMQNAIAAKVDAL